MLGKRRTSGRCACLWPTAAVLVASFLAAYALRVLLNRPLPRTLTPTA